MKSKKILIVDDNDLNRKLFENLIGQIWSYHSAIDGLEALEQVKEHRFDLILMDIQMPKLDGISALKQMKAGSMISCPVIAVTAFADESDRLTFLSQGFDEFITKPIRPREFLEKIKNVLESDQSKNSNEKLELENVYLDMGVFNQLGKYNKLDMIRKVYSDFIKESKELEQQITLQLREQNYGEICECIHILKGNSGTLGANRVFLQSQKAEISANNGDWEGFSKHFEILKNEIESFQNYLIEATIFET